MARRSSWLVLTCIACLAHPQPLAAQAPDAPPDAPTRAFIASRMYSAIQTYFAHWDGVPGFDLDRRYREYLEEALRAQDRRSFSMASMAFLASLGNSHTGFGDTEMDPARGVPYEFRVRAIEDAFVIAESRRPDLEPGRVITHVNDVAIAEFYARLRPYIPASTERYRRHRLFDPWQSHLLPKPMRLRLDDGRTVTVDRRNGGGRGPEPVTEGRWLVPDRIAFIRVPSWAGRQFQDRALELLDQFKSAGALVIDVRGNTGGGTPSRFISALMDRDWPWWAESTPLRFGVYSYYANQGDSELGGFARPNLSWPSATRMGSSAFVGRMAILIDAGCHSACEDFVMPFKANGRAILVGQCTAGSSGQPYQEEFANGMGFGIGAKREIFPDGSPFEGVGVAPDIAVRPTVQDIRAGRDPELAAALQELTSADKDPRPAASALPAARRSSVRSPTGVSEPSC